MNLGLCDRLKKTGSGASFQREEKELLGSMCDIIKFEGSV